MKSEIITRATPACELKRGRREVLRGAAGALACGALGMALPLLQAHPVQAATVKSEVSLHDVELLDAISSERKKLVSDVMGDRVVVLNFMFTECSTTCPMQSVALSKAQPALGKRLGSQVVFISISLDPGRDTAARLQRFAKHHGAGPSWRFLTGELATIDRIRAGFGVESPKRDDHPPVISIGRADSATWSRLYGMPGPRAIVSEVKAWLR